MMNSRLVRDKAKPHDGSYLAGLLDQDLEDERLVESLFWQFLTRAPYEREMADSVELLASRGSAAGGEDLQWLLMNKLEFMFNR